MKALSSSIIPILTIFTYNSILSTIGCHAFNTVRFLTNYCHDSTRSPQDMRRAFVPHLSMVMNDNMVEISETVGKPKTRKKRIVKTKVKTKVKAKVKTKVKAKVKAKKKKSKTKKPTTIKASRKTEEKVKGKAKTARKKKKKTKKGDEIYFWSNSSDVCNIQHSTIDNVTDTRFHTLISMQNETATTLVKEVAAASNNTESIISSEERPKMIHFTIRGNPLPLQRHRTYKNFVYNPSAKKQQFFYETTLSMLPTLCFNRNHSHIPSKSHESDENEISRVIQDDTKKPELLTVVGNTSTLIQHTKDIDLNTIQPFFTEDEFLHIKIMFYLKRPKNHFKSSIPGSGRIRPKFKSPRCQSTRTDVDNMAKFVLDALNAKLYVDDRQVVELHVMKMYDNEEECLGRTKIWITKLEDENYM